MSGTWQQKWNALREKRSGYPRFRQALLWTRDIGLVLVVALCMGLALFASPTVLSDHPWLQAYVDFMGGYFGAVQRLSVGALHPQVSQLVFAVGWGVAMVPFVASLLHTVIYSLVIDYQHTKAEMASRYETVLKDRMGGLATFMDILSGPFMIAMVAFFTLGDLGVIHSFGWINGVLMTKAHSSQGHLILMNMVFMHLYTSRAGLGFIASLVIYGGVVLYPSFLLFIFVLFPIWLNRMRRRLTRQRVE